MNDQASKRSTTDRSHSVRLRDQPLLPLPRASCAGGLDSLSTAIQTTLPPPQDDRDRPEERYVRAVLARYLWLPDTPSQSSRHDRRLAHTLFDFRPYLGIAFFNWCAMRGVFAAEMDVVLGLDSENLAKFLLGGRKVTQLCAHVRASV